METPLPFHMSRAAALVSSVVLLAVLGALDYLTGAELSFSIFYLAPVTVAAVFAGQAAGLGFAFAGAIVWLAADIFAGQHYSAAWIPWWNASVRLGYFALHTILLTSLLRHVDAQRHLARHDALTGAANLRWFVEVADAELRRARRAHRPVTVAFMDLDHFKQANDTLGHDVGNEILLTVAERMRAEIRAADVLARVGGDEFALLLPETDAEGTLRVLHRLRERLLGDMRSRGWPVTFSIGAVTALDPPEGVETLLRAADALMYAVKRDGGSGIRHALHEEAAAPPPAMQGDVA